MAQDITPAELEKAYAHCARLIQAHDRDRFLASLFAPLAARRHLSALYAFNLEVARVREVVREPLPGEMRLQWWRDLIEGLGRGEVAGHPVASALMDTLTATTLSRPALLNLLEARTFDLYDDPMPTLNDLEGYAGETASVLIQLSAGLLLGAPQTGLATASGHAGVAVAVTGLMRALPIHAARGQCFLPLDLLNAYGGTREDVVGRKATAGVRETLTTLRRRVRHHLAAAQEALAGAPPEAMAAFLPLALVPGDLHDLERAGDPFAAVVGAPPLVRQWRLWRAARKARAGRPFFTLPDV
ncbi:phytoene/squalene synthase family protein [Aquabacter cavernae]|uniref:phytoene/squalene synthase family protein n=1 Tax=Aquabacter cavernae TaxID=2496029 RepID=UPI000F8E6ABD|nr:phytoene/squalene synthase family protein [Aquabacter cavernae]